MAKITSLAELTDVASDDLLVVVDKSDTSMADSGTDKKVQKVNLLKGLVPENGWIPAGETWTYASADDPTFTFTISGDKTSKYSAGMKIKLTQTTVKYFIITKVAYSSPNTTITVYGGTDYDLTSGAITNPYYSMVKAPQGFPLDPDKWSVIVTDTTERSQSNPINDAWYNAGSISIDIPLGIWSVSYQAFIGSREEGQTATGVRCCLSTANDSASDLGLVAEGYSSNVVLDYGFTAYREKTLTLATKGTYYMNIGTRNVNIDVIRFRNNLSHLIIRATCAYL